MLLYSQAKFLRFEYSYKLPLFSAIFAPYETGTFGRLEGACEGPEGVSLTSIAKKRL